MAERKSRRTGIDNKNREILIWNYACFLLSRRIYSEKELTNKLKRKFFDDFEKIQKVVDKLKYYKYLDDSESSKIIIEQLKKKGYGPKYISNYLLRRGFADLSLDINYDYNMKKWYEKKMGDKKISDLKTFRKMYNYLLNKGFMSEDIIEFLKGWTEYER